MDQDQVEKVQKKDPAHEEVDREEEKVQEVDQEQKKVQEQDHTHHDEIEGGPEFSPCISHSLSTPCQPCQGQPLQKSISDGLSNDAESVCQLVQEKKRYKGLCEGMKERIWALKGEPESVCQLVQEKKRYKDLYEGMKERCWALKGEHETQRQYIIRKDEEVLYLRHQIQELSWHHGLIINALNEKVKELQQNCRDLSLKIEKAEHLHSQQSMADSGSYQDSAATPPLLRAATDSVKDAITACATELFSRIKKNSLAMNGVRMNIDLKETAQINKVALQSFLCRVVFEGFEDPIFSASDGIPLFVKPASRKDHLFQGYKRCRDLDARQMLNEETEFIRFFDVKESILCKQLIEQLFMMDEVQKAEDFAAYELRSRNNNLHRQLLRLVKAVWLLHKLAFSFEPSAEIIRVGQGSVLDDEFMEDVAGDDDEEDIEKEIFAEKCKRVKKVRFMCVPGFIVRHTIIKARVFCLGRSERDICGQTEDHCSMTLG